VNTMRINASIIACRLLALCSACVDAAVAEAVAGIHLATRAHVKSVIPAGQVLSACIDLNAGKTSNVKAQTLVCTRWSAIEKL